MNFDSEIGMSSANSVHNELQLKLAVYIYNFVNWTIKRAKKYTAYVTEAVNADRDSQHPDISIKEKSTGKTVLIIEITAKKSEEDKKALNYRDKKNISYTNAEILVYHYVKHIWYKVNEKGILEKNSISDFLSKDMYELTDKS